MPAYDRNSEWEKLTRDLLTDKDRVGQSLASARAFTSLMRRYRAPALGYLHSLLLRHKLVANQDAAAEASALIWEELLRVMPQRLAAEWADGKKSFRILLREGLHAACHSWSKPASRALMVPGLEDDDAWKDEIRQAMITGALQRLQTYQREFEHKGNLYFLIFTLWDGDRAASHDVLAARLAAAPGGRKLDSTAFRKALERARDQFGKYLFEEMTAWVATRDAPPVEDYLKAFEELDLLDDYAVKSKTCRWLLGFENEAP